MRVVGKIYGRVLVSRVKESTREWVRNKGVLVSVRSVGTWYLH